MNPFSIPGSLPPIPKKQWSTRRFILRSFSVFAARLRPGFSLVILNNVNQLIWITQPVHNIKYPNWRR